MAKYHVPREMPHRGDLISFLSYDGTKILCIFLGFNASVIGTVPAGMTLHHIIDYSKPVHGMLRVFNTELNVTQKLYTHDLLSQTSIISRCSEI